MVNSLGNILSPSQGKQLQAIKNTQRVVDDVQQQLASGKNVNKAIDDPQNFFASQSLQNRALDLARLLDGIGESIRVTQETDQGIKAIQRLIDQADALLVEAELELYNDATEYVPEPTIHPNNISEFSSYSGGQDIGGLFTLQDDNTGIYFDGNLWKRIDLNYTITPETILRFEYQSTAIPEISTIGFDNDLNFANNNNHFFIYGTQTGGITYAAPTPTFEYDGSGDVVTIEIPVGTFFTGTFTGLHLIHDDDGPAPFGNALWRNITLFEGDDPVVSGSDLALPADKIERAAQYESQYNDILDQIDAITEDANYRGINLLRDEDLVTDFNEDRSNTLVTEGTDATANGLGLERADFSRLSRLTGSQDKLRDARQTLRSYNASIASDLNVITTRQTFTQNTINTLKNGSDDLVVGDANKNGAELLATQVRQSIQFSVLSLTQASIADFL